MSDFKNDIGFELKNARENNEMTQAEVMQLTGINRKSLSGYENNVAQPDLMTFATLVKLYNTSADTLLGIKQTPCKQALSRTERQILNKIRRLDQQHLDELDSLLDILIKYSEKI